LRRGGHYTFTVEALCEEEFIDEKISSKGYHLQKTGRFGFVQEHIDQLIQTCFGDKYSVAM
jgi:hypothetical protein